MGLQVQFMDPAGFEAASRYLRFFRDRRDLYSDRETWAEAGLVFPRQAVWERHPEAVEAFRAIGRSLVDGHVLFDVIWDQKVTAARLNRYAAVVVPGAAWLPENAVRALAAFERGGGIVIRETDPKIVLARLDREPLSRAAAPWTLRAAGYQRKGGCELHLVNYDRDETKGAEIRGAGGECPRRTGGIDLDLRLPKGMRVRDVSAISPDAEEPAITGWKQERDRLRFRVPGVDVYTIVRIRYA